MQDNRYTKIIDSLFFDNYKKGREKIPFKREDFEKAAKKLKIVLPKNVGDVLYSFRFRNPLPSSITKLAPEGKEWLIKLAGRGSYVFSLEEILQIEPNTSLTFTKILDATPAIIRKYKLNDEQALLAILRYNRLIDIFLGITCYSLQSHLRTTVVDIGQVETDEIYIGIDRKGAHYVIPVQAKGGNDRQGKVQIEQDFALCKTKYPAATCLAVAAQFMKDEKIALFLFEASEATIKIALERHYKLVPATELSDEEIESYANRPQ
jgi:hypothetical protein